MCMKEASPFSLLNLMELEGDQTLKKWNILVFPVDRGHGEGI